MTLGRAGGSGFTIRCAKRKQACAPRGHKGVRPSEILARWREEHITQKPPSTGFVRITLGIFRVIGYGLSDLITSSPFPFMEMWVMSFASTGIFITTDPQNQSGCRRKS